MKKIVRANANRFIKSEIDPAFFIEYVDTLSFHQYVTVVNWFMIVRTPRFLDIRLGEPRLEESMIGARLTPMLCRQRDITYAAPLLVDVDLLKGNQVVRRRNVEIGRLGVQGGDVLC